MGLNWDAKLKMTEIKLEKIPDIEKYLFIYLWHFYFFAPEVHFIKTQLGTWTHILVLVDYVTNLRQKNNLLPSKVTRTFPKMKAVMKAVVKAISLKKLLQKE